MNYFVVGPNGERFGPASVDELNQWGREGRVNTTTMVVAEGLTDMMPISNVAGFRLEIAPMPPHQGQYQNPSPYMRTTQVPNHLAKAIISTLLCCLPLGVVAIVYAAKVDSLARTGNIAEAEDASQKASMWANWSIGVWLVGAVLYITLIIGLGATGNLK
jgi:Interferon-induced transmembrane protein/GYF domain 2